MTERVRDLKRYSEMRVGRFGTAPAIFESVVADHLTSESGVNWRQRICTVSDDKKTTLLPLVIRLSNLDEGEVPIYDKMEPMVLYKSLNVNFPFCDQVYKEPTKDRQRGKLVCIQVSLEAKGKRDVKIGAFERFCDRMGWGDHPSKEQVDLISYVYCPNPVVADKAQVTFEADVRIEKYTVWYVNADFSS